MKSSLLVTLLASSLVVAPRSVMAQKKSGTPAASTQSASPGNSQASAAPAGNAPLEVQMLSYSSLDQLLIELSDYVCDQSGYQKVAVFDPPALQSLEAFDSFFLNAEAIRSGFSGMAGAGGAAGIDVFSDITQAVATVATASNSESASSFTIQDPTVALMLLNRLRNDGENGCANLRYAGVYSVGEAAAGPPLNDPREELRQLGLARATALRSIQLAPAGGAPPAGVPCRETAATPQDACFIAFSDLDGAYTAFLATLSTPNPTTGQPLLSSVQQGYPIRKLISSATAENKVLGIYVSIAAAGGTQQDRKNLLTALFTGDWIRYSGGVSVNVIVFSIGPANPTILYSGLLRFRTPLTKIKKPQKYNHADNAGDNLSDLP